MAKKDSEEMGSNKKLLLGGGAVALVGAAGAYALLSDGDDGGENNDPSTQVKPVERDAEIISSYYNDTSTQATKGDRTIDDIESEAVDWLNNIGAEPFSESNDGNRFGNNGLPPQAHAKAAKAANAGTYTAHRGVEVLQDVEQGSLAEDAMYQLLYDRFSTMSIDTNLMAHIPAARFVCSDDTLQSIIVGAGPLIDRAMNALSSENPSDDRVTEITHAVPIAVVLLTQLAQQEQARVRKSLINQDASSQSQSLFDLYMQYNFVDSGTTPDITVTSDGVIEGSIVHAGISLNNKYGSGFNQPIEASVIAGRFDYENYFDPTQKLQLGSSELDVVSNVTGLTNEQLRQEPELAILGYSAIAAVGANFQGTSPTLYPVSGIVDLIHITDISKSATQARTDFNVDALVNKKGDVAANLPSKTVGTTQNFGSIVTERAMQDTNLL